MKGGFDSRRPHHSTGSWQAREVRYRTGVYNKSGTGRNPIHSGYLLEANKTLELTPGAVPSVNAHRIIGDVRKRMNPGHDVLRHTFIFMLVGAHKSVDAAALQAGNSEAVIRKHYLDLRTEEEARAFWGIGPET